MARLLSKLPRKLPETYLAETKDDSFARFEKDVFGLEIDDFARDDVRVNVGRRRHHSRGQGMFVWDAHWN